MQLPTIETKAHDAATDVTYIVKAYRAITRDELLMAIGMYRRQNKKKLKRGSTVTIISLLGSER